MVTRSLRRVRRVVRTQPPPIQGSRTAAVQVFLFRAESFLGSELFDVDGPVVIGRGSRCSLPLGGDTVSRMHARLLFDGSELLIEDLGSSNGTYVNRVRVVGIVPVLPTDAIHIGSYTLKVRSLRSARQRDELDEETGATTRVEAVLSIETDGSREALVDLSAGLDRRLYDDAIRRATGGEAPRVPISTGAHAKSSPLKVPSEAMIVVDPEVEARLRDLDQLIALLDQKERAGQAGVHLRAIDGYLGKPRPPSPAPMMRAPIGEESSATGRSEASIEAIPAMTTGEFARDLASRLALEGKVVERGKAPAREETTAPVTPAVDGSRIHVMRPQPIDKMVEEPRRVTRTGPAPGAAAHVAAERSRVVHQPQAPHRAEPSRVAKVAEVSRVARVDDVRAEPARVEASKIARVDDVRPERAHADNSRAEPSRVARVDNSRANQVAPSAEVVADASRRAAPSAERSTSLQRAAQSTRTDQVAPKTIPPPEGSRIARVDNLRAEPSRVARVDNLRAEPSRVARTDNSRATPVAPSAEVVADASRRAAPSAERSNSLQRAAQPTRANAASTAEREGLLQPAAQQSREPKAAYKTIPPPPPPPPPKTRVEAPPPPPKTRVDAPPPPPSKTRAEAPPPPPPKTRVEAAPAAHEGSRSTSLADAPWPTARPDRAPAIPLGEIYGTSNVTETVDPTSPDPIDRPAIFASLLPEQPKPATLAARPKTQSSSPPPLPRTVRESLSPKPPPLPRLGTIPRQPLSELDESDNSTSRLQDRSMLLEEPELPRPQIQPQQTQAKARPQPPKLPTTRHEARLVTPTNMQVGVHPVPPAPAAVVQDTFDDVWTSASRLPQPRSAVTKKDAPQSQTAPSPTASYFEAVEVTARARGAIIDVTKLALEGEQYVLGHKTPQGKVAPPSAHPGLRMLRINNDRTVDLVFPREVGGHLVRGRETVVFSELTEGRKYSCLRLEARDIATLILGDGQRAVSYHIRFIRNGVRD